MARTLQILSVLAGRPFASAIDVGGGEGYLAAILRDLTGSDVRSVDLSVEACHRAWELFGIQGYSAEAARLPFPDNTFDLAISSEVIEHLAQPVVAISELVRVSRRYVLISTEEACLTGELERRLRMAKIETAYPHAERNWFTASDFRTLLGEGVGLCSQRLELSQPTVDWLSRQNLSRPQVETLLGHLTATPRLDAAHKGLVILLDKLGPVGRLEQEWRRGAELPATWRERALERLISGPAARQALVLPDVGVSTIGNLLRCPDCHGAIVSSQDRLACRQCGRIYPVIDGVPALLGSAPVSQEAEEESIHLLSGGEPRRAKVVRRMIARMHGARPMRARGMKRSAAGMALRGLLFLSRAESAGTRARRVHARLRGANPPDLAELAKALALVPPADEAAAV
jgi:uncharacterized protein YbaR (Trm112 family)/SAM-dependent methyltransferase